ncbi:class I SAM-dependent methyltransferase [Lewinella sp. IMCC34183]|uniref:class I SAM-dependent methyltransferase n=1 Tax=Lewinella sp. IMCC34183 TaxID=2248762 RepID=UPI000E27C9FE|nr:class I SAM-dependent methyltransferase [Lewinella sp. IMCC34183]
MKLKSKIEGILERRLSPDAFQRTKRTYQKLRSVPNRKNLTRIGEIYGTDKTGVHFYTQHYQRHFGHLRNRPVRMLEIGVGGYAEPDQGGHSLRMWKEYFWRGQIYALDIYDKSLLEEKRIRIFQGSQVDTDFLEEVVQETGPLDLIVDDGSHLNDHVITTFEFLFPYLKGGGIYAIEDVQTSYWPDYGGDSNDLQQPGTIMNYFKQLTDSLNHQELMRPGYVPTYYDRNIVAMHFYHNMIFIEKGANNEQSNMVRNNVRIPRP